MSPRRVRLCGVLDMVRASTQTFALKLDDGQEARGSLTDGAVGGRYTVDAYRIFKADGDWFDLVPEDALVACAACLSGAYDETEPAVCSGPRRPFAPARSPGQNSRSKGIMIGYAITR